MASFEVSKKRTIELALLLVGCKGTGEAQAAVTEDAALTTPPAIVEAAPPVRDDVTFFATSDLHFGHPGLDAPNKTMAAVMETLAMQPLRMIPTAVRAPRGVLMAGDLTEEGLAKEWRAFLDVYGPTYSLPVMEVVGNHDKRWNWDVWNETSKRHGGKWYAWDWDRVRIYALAEAPDGEGLDFLEKDLAARERCTPIVLYFHLPLAGPFSTGNWFGDGDYRDRLAAILAHRNVVAILHGHHHASGAYTWHGIDVMKVGAVKTGPHSFMVVHVGEEEATFVRYDWEKLRWGTPTTKKIVCPTP